MKSGLVQPAIATGLTTSLASLQDIVLNLERICNTPLPFAYQVHLRMSLWYVWSLLIQIKLINCGFLFHQQAIPFFPTRQFKKFYSLFFSFKRSCSCSFRYISHMVLLPFQPLRLLLFCSLDSLKSDKKCKILSVKWVGSLMHQFFSQWKPI